MRAGPGGSQGPATSVDIYCASYVRPPRAVTPDIDDTVDVVHGNQQIALFNAHYDERCFQPIHVYDTATSRPVAMLLRPGKTPSGEEIRFPLRRLVRRIRSHWPTTRRTIRGDGHYSRPKVMAWCEANGVAYIQGLPGNAVLERLVEPATVPSACIRVHPRLKTLASLNRHPAQGAIIVPRRRTGPHQPPTEATIGAAGDRPHAPTSPETRRDPPGIARRAQAPTDCTAPNPTVSAPRSSCKPDDVFCTPVAVPVTVKRSGVVLPSAFAPITETL